MRLDRQISLLLIRPVLRSGLFGASYQIPVLMYHSICEDEEPEVSAYYRLTTSPARFRQHMEQVCAHGYTTTDLSGALQRLSHETPTDKPQIVVTFDDGFRDFATNAWPTLSELGLTAMVFLPTASIGRTRRSFKGRECMTWGEIRTLHKEGVRFGAHTVTHPVLRGLLWSQLRSELRDSRRQIEDELGAAIDAFAYPYAFPQEDKPFVAAFRTELVQQGYAAAVTTVVGRLSFGHDPMAIRRLPVNECDDEALFRAKLAGAYDWVGGVQKALRRAKALARGQRASE